MKLSLHVIGNGYFGSFLTELFSPFVSFDEKAPHKILAVPYEAYETVAAEYKGAHLINVCSVQEETNNICLGHSDLVTGFHPLFGPRSPKEGRSGILTHSCEESAMVVELFEKVGTRIVTDLNGKAFDGASHDQLMAKTHGLTVWFQELLASKIGDLNEVPDYCVTPTFKALRDFHDQLGDFSEGTLSSIKANKYL